MGGWMGQPTLAYPTLAHSHSHSIAQKYRPLNPDTGRQRDADATSLLDTGRLKRIGQGVCII
jgi:hypothetical protein